MKGWRTLAVNVGVILSVIVPLISLPEWQDVIPPKYLPLFILGVALANVGLRLITTSPVGRK